LEILLGQNNAVMRPQIGFCVRSDGVHIAYMTVGEGPALVFPAAWVSHIELQWEQPEIRSFYQKLARHHTVVLYDKHGVGLSDRDRTDFTLEAELRDLEAVVDHLRLKRFALLNVACGGPTAIAYTIKYPQRVTHLIFYGAYARGEAIASDETRLTMLSFIRTNWGLGSRAFTDVLVPNADANVREWMVKFQRKCATAEMVAQLLNLSFRVEVSGLLPKLRTPTLVLHRQHDMFVPFKLGRELAASIPGAHFVPMEGNDHLPTFGDSDSVVRAIAEFLGDPVTAGQAVESSQPAVPKLTPSADDPATREARSFIAAMNRLALRQYCVVGKFTRYDDTVRNALKDVRQKITAGFDRPSRKRENHFFWAAPGSGKTYFAQQVATSLPQPIHYQECNLAKCSQEEFLSGLAKLDARDKACLCLIDEVDAKPKEVWPYEVLLPYLDANVDRGAHFVFILAGSCGSSLIEIKNHIASRPKGADLLSRIPTGNEYEIPPMDLGDRLLVVLSQFRQAGQEMSREVQAVEKLGLYYIALNSRLTNARQLRELAVRAVERLPTGEDRVKYDHLFGAGDPENKAFWMQSLPAATDLANRFVTLED
jgi:pimeloyl-ACP methyl ester carboxylesterase